jgi:hypothetical protein
MFSFLLLAFIAFFGSLISTMIVFLCQNLLIKMQEMETTMADGNVIEVETSLYQ